MTYNHNLTVSNVYAYAQVSPISSELGLSEFEASTLVSAVAGGALCARVIYALFFDVVPLKWRILYIVSMHLTDLACLFSFSLT